MSGYDLHLVASSYDNVAKAIISAGWATSSDGDVESPTGAFAYFDVPNPAPSDSSVPFRMTELGSMVDAIEMSEETWMTEMLPAGWYVAVENSDGIIHVWNVGMGLDARAGYIAKVWFERKVADYVAWADQD